MKEPVFFKNLQDGNRTYELYIEDDAEVAKAWLLTKIVEKPEYYITVKTKQGTWGMDKAGLYLTNLLPWQTDFSLAQIEGSVAGIPSMFNIGIAERGIADNFVVQVQCGKDGCASLWHDALRYQDKTIVCCPKCSSYNIIDSHNIHYLGEQPNETPSEEASDKSFVKKEAKKLSVQNSDELFDKQIKDWEEKIASIQATVTQKTNLSIFVGIPLAILLLYLIGAGINKFTHSDSFDLILFFSYPVAIGLPILINNFLGKRFKVQVVQQLADEILQTSETKGISKSKVIETLDAKLPYSSICSAVITKVDPKKAAIIKEEKAQAANNRKAERAEAHERSNRNYFSVHCPYCGGQSLYKKNETVYCDGKSCPNYNKPVDIDRYNLRRFIH